MQGAGALAGAAGDRGPGGVGPRRGERYGFPRPREEPPDAGERWGGALDLQELPAQQRGGRGRAPAAPRRAPGRGRARWSPPQRRSVAGGTLSGGEADRPWEPARGDGRLDRHPPPRPPLPRWTAPQRRARP